ncbi:MAG: TDT family transporter, partial [Syntrophobacteraceae bacterium]
MSFAKSLRRRIHRLPLAASGLMLGVAGEGTLLSSYGMVKDIFGAIAFIILTLLLLKIVFDGKDVINGLRDASPAGSAFTFPMAIVILSVYVLPLQPIIAKCMFWIAILIHCFGILLFTKKFLIPFAIENIFPSTFVVYVGTVIISVVAPAFHKIVIGQVFFIFGFISYLILLPIVLYRALT